MRDITLCHPRLQLLAGQLVDECNKQGLKIKIGETFRQNKKINKHFEKLNSM